MQAPAFLIRPPQPTSAKLVTTSVCVRAPRNPFESAQTARFNNPKVLSLLQTMSSIVLPCSRAAQRA